MKKILLLVCFLVLIGAGCNSDINLIDNSLSTFEKETICTELAFEFDNSTDADFVLNEYCYDEELDTCIAVIQETDSNGTLFYVQDLNHNKNLEEWYNGSNVSFGSAGGIFSHCD